MATSSCGPTSDTRATQRCAPCDRQLMRASRGGPDRAALARRLSNGRAPANMSVDVMGRERALLSRLSRGWSRRGRQGSPHET